jgi:hypothetical protein
MPGQREIDMDSVGEGISFALTDQDHADHGQGGGDYQRYFQEGQQREHHVGAVHELPARPVAGLFHFLGDGAELDKGIQVTFGLGFPQQLLPVHRLNVHPVPVADQEEPGGEDERDPQRNRTGTEPGAEYSPGITGHEHHDYRGKQRRNASDAAPDHPVEATARQHAHPEEDKRDGREGKGELAQGQREPPGPQQRRDWVVTLPYQVRVAHRLGRGVLVLRLPRLEVAGHEGQVAREEEGRAPS